MIVLLIYLIGVVIAFISLVHIEREDGDITLGDTLYLCVVSCSSWIIVFGVLVMLALSYLDKDIDNIVLFKKKEKKRHE